MPTPPSSNRTPSSLQERIDQLQEVAAFPPPAEFARHAQVTDPAVYDLAAADQPAWWAEQARSRLDWQTPFSAVLDESNPPFYTWFADGTLNASYNCLDRHVNAGLGDRVAFHWHGEEGEERLLTYAQILADVQRLAGAMKSQGVRKGDVVGIYLPMIPEVVVAMLACARIGAPHNVVFGGFAPSAVRERMEVSEAKALITTDGARRRGKTAAIKEAVDAAVDGLDTLQTIIVVRSTGIPCPMQDGRDHWYDELLAAADPECPAEPMEAEHPLFFLYSSGSTAKPKGIVHTTGGYLTGVATTMAMVFDLNAERDVFWCTADVGWITGHSYIVYGPMANGATSVMFEGAPGLPGQGRLVEPDREGPGLDLLHRADRDPQRHEVGRGVPRRHDLSSLRLLGSVGEPINPEGVALVLRGHRRRAVPDCRHLVADRDRRHHDRAAARPDPHQAGLGHPRAARRLRRAGRRERQRGPGGRRPAGADPAVAGMLRTLFNDPDRYVDTYWSRFGPPNYFVGDGARRDEDGYFWITGRVDDVINVSGHRLSTAEIESALVAHATVAEAAVIAITDDMSGQAVVAYVTVVGEADPGPDLATDLRDYVGTRIGKFARPKRLIWTGELPKTRSGKIMRRLLRDIAEGRDLGDVTTLADPTVVSALQQAAADGNK